MFVWNVPHHAWMGSVFISLFESTVFISLFESTVCLAPECWLWSPIPLYANVLYLERTKILKALKICAITNLNL